MSDLREKPDREFKFYDIGWNDRVEGKPLPWIGRCDRSYIDGWRDCDEETRKHGPQDHQQ